MFEPFSALEKTRFNESRRSIAVTLTLSGVACRVTALRQSVTVLIFAAFSKERTDARSGGQGRANGAGQN